MLFHRERAVRPRGHGQLFVAVAQVVLLIIEALLLLHLSTNDRVSAIAADDGVAGDFRDGLRNLVQHCQRRCLQIDADTFLLKEEPHRIVAGRCVHQGKVEARSGYGVDGFRVIFAIRLRA